MCLADGDFKKAIDKLNDLENELYQLGLDDKNINEVLVSINYSKSIIYSLLNEPLNSTNSLNIYLKESDLLLKNIPNLDNSYISNRNNELQGIGIVGGLDDRLIEARKSNQIRNRIFINILNNNVKYSRNYISSLEKGELSPREILFFNDLINYKLKILVRDLSNYGMKQFIRVSIGSTSDLKKFLKELRNSINKKNA